MEFTPHDVQWNEKKIIDFWNNRPTPESFAGTAAKGIIAFVKRYAPIRGVAIDYGCGRGDFLSELLKEKVSVIAADNSEGVLRGVKERFADKVTSTILITKPPLALKDALGIVTANLVMGGLLWMMRDLHLAIKITVSAIVFTSVIVSLRIVTPSMLRAVMGRK